VKIFERLLKHITNTAMTHQGFSKELVFAEINRDRNNIDSLKIPRAGSRGIFVILRRYLLLR
jgi:hypothetical protein